MSKKLVQINGVCNGSTGRIMTQIQQKAIEEGWEAYSFYGRGKPANEYCYKIGNEFDILWHVFLTRIFDKHGHGAKSATKKLIKRIEQINPDVIQIHNIHGYYINIEILFNYLKKCNKKIVWTLHDCWAFTGHCAYFTYPKCDKWKTQCANCIRKNDYPVSRIKDNSKQQYEIKKRLFTKINNLTIVTPSNWLKTLVKQSFLKEYNIQVINNGIDLQKFKQMNDNEILKKYNIPLDKKIIIGVASVWDRRKGLNEFIQLANIIDNDSIIVLVGLNRKQIRKLPKNIIGIKRTESVQELANLYTIANVFVNPTLEDNFPTTNIEAIACDTPVITYNTGGSIECINENSGLIVESNSVEELWSKIKLAYSTEFHCLSEAIKYNKDFAYEKYINLYKDVGEN